jgi:sugar/nucleoside kinase (ribokinase family)
LDTFGDFLVEFLSERGLDAQVMLRDCATPTSATVLLVDGAGERSFLHLPGASGALIAEELPTVHVFAGRALHVAGALVMPALNGVPTAELLAKAYAAESAPRWTRSATPPGAGSGSGRVSRTSTCSR